MTGSTKAAPREKEVKFDPTPYRVVEKSFINGSLHEAGTEPVFLPEGVKAGGNLEPVNASDAVADDDQGNEFIDRTIPDIVADVPALTDDELVEHLAAERAGKNRKGVTDAIEKEIEARKEA